MNVQLTFTRQSLSLIPLALAMLLPSLGTSITNVALPALETAFDASLGRVQWVVIAYLLAVTTMIVGVGRLGDLFGRRKLLLAGIAVFTLASAGAALAPSLSFLIAARAVQGSGAATMMALAIASVSDLVPKERTGSVMGLLGTVSAVGTALGPSLGGALLASGGWQSVFVALVAAGLATYLISVRSLPRSPARHPLPVTFDLPGMLLLAASLGAFALSTTVSNDQPGLLNAGLAALAVAGFAALTYVERRAASPLIDIERLMERRLGAGLISLGLVSTIMMATLVVGPFYLTETLSLTPLQTGLVMSLGPAVAALAGLPAGRLVDRCGSSSTMLTGLSMITIGAALMTVLPGLFSTGGYAGSLIVITAGYALFQAANNTAVMSDAPSGRKGVTSGLLGLARNLGLITGASAMGAVFAMGSHGIDLLGLPPGRATGLSLTFGVATLVAAIAGGISLRSIRPAKG